jgi:cell filamentation protein
MDEVEFKALVKAQEQYIQKIGPATRFTVALIRDMHRTWLGRIYAWAGECRTVELQKGRFKWPPAYLVKQNMNAFEAGLLRKNTPCRPGTAQEVARCIAEVHAELLLIHPFREGNGRLARWLADLMALQAGLPAPEYRFEGKEQEKNRQFYLAAVTRGYARDYDALTDFFATAIAARLEGRK